MSADGNSQLEGLWDALSLAVLNAYDAYGWIVPALLLTVLFLGLLALISYLMEDPPFDVEVFQGVGGIFRWTRRWWKDDEAGLTIREPKSRN